MLRYEKEVNKVLGVGCIRYRCLSWLWSFAGARISRVPRVRGLLVPSEVWEPAVSGDGAVFSSPLGFS